MFKRLIELAKEQRKLYKEVEKKYGIDVYGIDDCHINIGKDCINITQWYDEDAPNIRSKCNDDDATIQLLYKVAAEYMEVQKELEDRDTQRYITRR